MLMMNGDRTTRAWCDQYQLVYLIATESQMGFTPAANASSTLSKRKGSKKRRSHRRFLFFIREVIGVETRSCKKEKRK